MTLRELEIKYAEHVFSVGAENGKDVMQFFREFRVALFSDCLKRHLVCKSALGHYLITGTICNKSGVGVEYEMSVAEHLRIYPFKVMYREKKGDKKWCVLQNMPKEVEKYLDQLN